MDSVFLALRVVVSLGAVLAVIWFARRWITGGAKARVRTRSITVLAKQTVGPKASVAVVEADGRRYLLGVTEHSVSVLDQLETMPAEVKTTPIPLPSFERVLEDARRLPTPPREPIPLPTASRRAAREAEAGRGPRSAVAGSILSPDTWRQTAMALRRAR